MEKTSKSAVGGSGLGSVALVLACAVTAAGLGACGSINEGLVGPMSSMPGIAMPADAPQRLTEKGPFPAVHDMPPPRASAVLDGVDQSKMEQELLAARNLQKTAAAVPYEPDLPPPPAPAAAKPPAAKPAAGAKLAVAAKPAAKPRAKPAPKPAAKPLPPPTAASTAPSIAPSAEPSSSNRMIY